MLHDTGNSGDPSAELASWAHRAFKAKNSSTMHFHKAFQKAILMYIWKTWYQCSKQDPKLKHYPIILKVHLFLPQLNYKTPIGLSPDASAHR